MIPNILQYPIALFALLKAGMVVVNINPLHSAEQCEHILHESRAKAIIISDDNIQTLAEIMDETKIVTVIYAMEEEDLIGKPQVNMEVRYFQNKFQVGELLSFS